MESDELTRHKIKFLQQGELPLNLEKTAETAKAICVSKWWLYQHVNEIPAAHRAGRILRWDIEALKKWMRERREEKPKVD